MEQIPPANHTKEKGIRGLKQIATQTIGEHKYPKRLEIITRYFEKFNNRMNKTTPLTHEERMEIIDSLMEIIAKTPAEEKEEHE